MEPGANKAELCRQYGISRKTGYKWLDSMREREREESKIDECLTE